MLHYIQLQKRHNKEVLNNVITIAELRARHNKMSQQELADNIEVGVDSVRRWERDINTISAKNLKKLSKYFKVSSDDLLGIGKKIYM